MTDLPAELGPQQRLLRSLIRWCQDDPEVRWLVIGCSLARGNADELSDLDTAVGVTDGQVAATAARIIEDIGGFGDLVACFDHAIPGVALPHRRIFAQFADRTQIDLVVADASNSTNPDSVVLYDPADMVVTDAKGQDDGLSDAVGTWSCQAWEALVNVGKYLRRQSLWEAYDRLHAARGHLWQLWAVAQGVPAPQYGLTSLLDVDGPVVFPVDMESTVAGVDSGDLLDAALHVARLLTDLEASLGPGADLRRCSALGRHVTEDLQSLRSVAD